MHLCVNCNVGLADWLLVVWSAGNHCCHFSLVMCQCGYSLNLNMIQHTEACFYTRGSHFTNISLLLSLLFHLQKLAEELKRRALYVCFVVSVLLICFFYSRLDPCQGRKITANLVSGNICMRTTVPACPSPICFPNKANIEGTNPSKRNCVWCLCIHVCFDLFLYREQFCEFAWERVYISEKGFEI